MCQNCDKRFPTNFLLKQHVDISHKGLNKRHMCDRCGKGFAYKNGIKDHPCRPGKTLFHFEIVIGLILILWYTFFYFCFIQQWEKIYPSPGWKYGLIGKRGNTFHSLSFLDHIFIKSFKLFWRWKLTSIRLDWHPTKQAHWDFFKKCS